MKRTGIFSVSRKDSADLYRSFRFIKIIREFM